MSGNQTNQSLSHLDCGFSDNNVNLVIQILYILTFPPAFLLNSVAAWVSLHLRSKSTFIVYLKSLIATDLLMSLTLPLWATKNLQTRSLGLRIFYCRFSSVFFYFCMNTNVILMGLISLDRFFKIVRPCGRLLGQNLGFSKVLSASIWLMLFCTTAVPNMILTNQGFNKTGEISCMSLKCAVGQQLHEGIVLLENAIFWVVGILIIFCYMCITKTVIQSFKNSKSSNSKGNQKTKFRVFVILAVFLLCSGPYKVVRLIYTYNQNNDRCVQALVKIAKEFTLWIATTSICLDPLMYCFLCRDFREKLKEIWTCGSL